MRRLSDRQGKGLLVVVDYYNLIDSSNFSGERAERLGQVAIHLRENMKKENIKSKKMGGIGVHMIVFAQETDNKATGEVYPFGSKEILQYSQVHLSIHRQVSEFDVPMTGALNAIGQQRFWCRQGELSYVTNMRILKANDNARGEVTVWIENNLTSVYNPAIPKTPGGL